MVKIRDAAVVVCGVQHSGSTNSKIRACHVITEGEYYGVTIAESRVSAVLHALFRPKGCCMGEGAVMVWDGGGAESIVFGSGVWPPSVR